MNFLPFRYRIFYRIAEWRKCVLSSTNPDKITSDAKNIVNDILGDEKDNCTLSSVTIAHRIVLTFKFLASIHEFPGDMAFKRILNFLETARNQMDGTDIENFVQLLT